MSALAEVPGSSPAVPQWISKAQRIAVLRANGLGDYLMAEPALASVRAAAPEATITLLGSGWEQQALPGRPGPVDEVVAVPWFAGVRTPVDPEDENPNEHRAFFDRMRSRHFDVAFQLHGGGRNSNPFVARLEATRTVGLQAADAPALDLSMPYQYWQPEVIRYLETVALAGVPAIRHEPRFTALQSDLEVARVALRRAGVDPAVRPVAVIHPGARDPRRRWPAERFASVADALHAAGAQVVVVGDAHELDVVAEVLRHAQAATALTNLSFAELTGVLASAQLLVANDSGPRHLAEALGTPTVSVYWFGNMITAGPRTRASHRVHISWTQQCPQCGTRCVGDPFPERCYHAISLVCDVRTDSVRRSALELFEHQNGLGT
jgi:ADP-heptose:LPS heptosyltransferase